MARNKIEEIEESKVEVKKRGRGRPKKGETLKKDLAIEKKTTKQCKKDQKHEESVKLAQVGDQLQSAEALVAATFSAKLPEYVEKRRIAFEEELERFKIANDVIIDAKGGKVSHYKLSNMLSKPLTMVATPLKFTAYDIALCAELYWDCVAMANESIVYIPTLQQLAGLMGTTVGTILDYKNSTDMSIRQTVERIYDKFVDFYTVKGLTNELNTIMSIFALKAQYGLRDNDTPQVTVNNYTQTVQQNSIDELEKQFNMAGKGIDVIDLEV
jgi:hypothetical protein